MSRFLWITDPHLNQCSDAQFDSFLASLSTLSVDGIWITGDFAEFPDLADILRRLAAASSAPIYFVLGNHDFYHSSIRDVRRTVTSLCDEISHLHYLTNSSPCQLTRHLSIMGDDGWADARIGDFDRSPIMLRDYRLIRDLADCDIQQRKQILHRLGDESARRARRSLLSALDMTRNVIMLTHIPPLREACWYEGQVADDVWAPHFTCAAMGAMITELMDQHPDHQLSVLCGHTHSAGSCQPLPNVSIYTGAAIVGQPTKTGWFNELGSRCE